MIAMTRSIVSRLANLSFTACLLVAAGCPSTVPPAGPKAGGSGQSAKADSKGLNESAADVEALKAAKASLTTDSAGNVVTVELDSASGNDEQLGHLKGLPNLRTLI